MNCLSNLTKPCRPTCDGLSDVQNNATCERRFRATLNLRWFKLVLNPKELHFDMLITVFDTYNLDTIRAHTPDKICVTNGH